MSLHTRPIEELVNAGVLAYRNQDFKTAIQYLQEVLESEPQNWRAKLYLGMAFFHSGEAIMATGQFRSLINTCTDPDIQKKAAAAMQALNSQNKSMPEMTCTIKKSSIPPDSLPLELDDSEGCDLEWVPQKKKSEHT
jgi:hypothetical protein